MITDAELDAANTYLAEARSGKDFSDELLMRVHVRYLAEVIIGSEAFKRPNAQAPAMDIDQATQVLIGVLRGFQIRQLERRKAADVTSRGSER